MGCLIEKLVFKRGIDRINKNEVIPELWDMTINDINGKPITLREYKVNKKAFIFVNVACKWGLTSDNYTQLVDLYNKYKNKGLQILGFPCGQFMNQELSTENEIKDFVSKKFEVDFPMLSKIEVNGENMHPIYKYLKLNSSQMSTEAGLKNIPWNFSKFLVDVNGKVIGYYEPKIKPNQMLTDIEKLLEIWKNIYIFLYFSF